MFITELFEAQNRNLVVVYAGRFQPFHKGHKAVYDYLLKHYGRDSVYIATSNKIDPPKSPFGFTDKTYFMQMMGIPMDRVIESSQPYKATELTSNYDKDNTVFLIAVSQKDMAEDPRFTVGTKKDGNPTYFQNLPTDLKNASPMSQHGYLVVVPTFDFTVMGQPMRSATEIRAMYGKSDEATRREIIQDLFGAYTQEAQHIMDSKLGVQEGLSDPGTDSISPIHGGTVSEGEVVPMTRGTVPPNYELALKLARSFISFDETIPDAHQQMEAILAKLNSMGYSLQSTLNPKHDGLDLVNKQSSFRQYVPYKINEGASGYIPKNSKEAKDPRWERALSVDVRPDTMKKEISAFYPTKAPKTQQHQVTESMYFQGYQVDLDQVNKELIVSQNGKVVHKEKTNLAGRPMGHTAIKQRLSLIIDKLEDDKYPDDLEIREAREPYQQAIDNLEWALIQRDRDEIDSLRQSIQREKASDAPNQAVIDAWNRKIDKLHNRIMDSLKLK